MAGFVFASFSLSLHIMVVKYISMYHIAGNFRGRKLSRIAEKYDFTDKTFVDADSSLVPRQRIPHFQISRRKLSRIAINPRNSQKFSPESFPLYGNLYDAVQHVNILTRF